MSQRSKVGQSQAPGSSLFRNFFIPNRYCRRYQSTGQCSFRGGCKYYLHSCVQCQGNYAATKCNKKSRPRKGGGQWIAFIGRQWEHFGSAIKYQTRHTCQLPCSQIGYTQSIIYTDHLLTGFLEGFKVGFSGEPTAQCPQNLLTRYGCHNYIVSVKLQKEIDLGRLSGPWPSPPFNNLVISPVGLVLKKSPGGFRLIHHLSHQGLEVEQPPGQGSSVNGGIPPDFTSVHYASVHDAIAMIKRLARGCFLARTDIKSAFRITPLHASYYHLFGIKWKNQY